jgi:hypothetical protein
MSTSSRAIRPSRERRLLLAAPKASRAVLAPLVDAYESAGIRVEPFAYGRILPTTVELADGASACDALLLAGSARLAPRTALSGPFVVTRDGTKVPAAWLPVSGQNLDAFVRAVQRVHERARRRASVALLGQWHPRYLRLAKRLDELVSPRFSTFRWTGDVILRDDLVTALGTGVGMALYVGHGRPVGWVGYHGVRARHFDAFSGEPLGAVFSLCCRTASRRRVGLSYAEGLALRGVAAASFGAVTDTLHTDNTRWAVGLCEALAGGAETVGELVVRSAPLNDSAHRFYRILGDPLAPLAPANGAERRARATPTYS